MESVLRRALARHPDSVPVINNLAQTLSDKGANKEALEIIKRAPDAAGPHSDTVRETRLLIEERLRAPLSAFGGRLDAERFDATLRRMASEHAQLLRTSVADFVARGTDIARVRSLRRDPREYDVAVWRHMAELGWAGMLVSDAHGSGLGLADAAIVAEGVGRALMPEPFTASAVLAAGDPPVRRTKHSSNPRCRRSS